MNIYLNFLHVICIQTWTNCIRDARTSQTGETAQDTMINRIGETVQRSADFHNRQCELCKGEGKITQRQSLKTRGHQ